MHRSWQLGKSIRLGIVSTAVALFCAGLVVVVTLTGSSSAQTTPRQTDASVNYFTSLPSGYGTASGEATDPQGRGVYIFAESRKHFTLFHKSPNARTDATYNIPRRSSLLAGVVTPIVVDHNGDVWIGINDSLVRVDPSTHAVRVIRLPYLPVVPRSLAHPPENSKYPARAYEDIESMASGAGGDIYVGRLFASDLQVVSPTTGSVKRIQLPNRSVLEGMGSDLAQMPDGQMGAVLYTATPVAGKMVLDATTGSHWRSVRLPCGTLQSVTSGPNHSFVATGSGCSSTLSQTAHGSVHAELLRANDAAGSTDLEFDGVTVAISSRCEILGDSEGGDLIRDGVAHHITIATTTADDMGSGGPIPTPMVTAAMGKTTMSKKIVQLSPWLLAAATPSKVWVIPNDLQRIGVINLRNCG